MCPEKDLGRCAIPGPLLPPPLLGSPSSPPPHILPSLPPSSLFMFAYFVSPSFSAISSSSPLDGRTEGLRGRGGGCGETHLSLPLPFPPSLWRSKYRQLQIFRRPPTPLLCPAHGHYSERQRRYFRWGIPLLSFSEGGLGASQNRLDTLNHAVNHKVIIHSLRLHLH